jgi:L-ribulokinase
VRADRLRARLLVKQPLHRNAALARLLAELAGHAVACEPGEDVADPALPRFVSPQPRDDAAVDRPAHARDLGEPGEFSEEARQRGVSVQRLLDEQASAEPVGAHGLIALDWAGGNRSVLVDGRLSGAIVGLTLATTAPEIYRALLESTAFGTRMIIDTFTAAGVPVTEFVAAGGLIKSAPLMQIYSDVLRRPLSVIGSEQGGALGSAIHAAVAAGAYPDVPTAADAMGQLNEDVYQPDLARADVYDELYAEYARLHDYFGRGGNEVMHRLRAIRDRAYLGRTSSAK